jgi:hypothetical protein
VHCNYITILKIELQEAVFPEGAIPTQGLAATSLWQLSPRFLSYLKIFVFDFVFFPAISYPYCISKEQKESRQSISE